MKRLAVCSMSMAMLLGCLSGRPAVNDAGEEQTGGTGGTRRLDAGAGTGGGGAGGTPVRVELWQPADPCPTTSALRWVYSAPRPPVPPDPSPPVVDPPTDEAGLQPLRRLTRLEYLNTVRDLLGVEVAPEALERDFPNESGFDVAPAVEPSRGQQLLETALTVAAAADQAITSMLPRCCAPAPQNLPQQEACAATFIEVFGRRAFRRPLVRAEGERLLALYRLGREAALGKDFPGGLRMVVAAALQSPQFLYHRELGPFPTTMLGRGLRLTPYEVASRMSYLYWASMPDEELFAAAGRNELETLDQLARQARRMLASPRSRAGLEDFHLQWLEIADLADETRPAPFSPELARSMLGETREFVSRLFAGQPAATLGALFTSSTSFVDPLLAAHYGLPPLMETAQVSLDPAQRAGVLTQASVLTGHARGLDSQPTTRGSFLQRRVLCMELPPPPIQVPEPPPGQTTRQRLAAHSMNPCAVCHLFIDPPGLAFEHYDGLGRYRATEGGQPVDASGALELDGQQVSFRDAIELAQLLARSPTVADCLGTQWLRYLQRRREVKEEQRAVDLLAAAGQRGDLRDMLVALTQIAGFRARKPGPGEVLP
jgi:hypothetical protein